MTVYAVAQITIHDRRRYERYASRLVGVLAGFGRRLLAADTSPEVLSGVWPDDKLVLLEFADRALLDAGRDHRSTSRTRRIELPPPPAPYS